MHALAPRFGKARGQAVASGLAALDLALRTLGVGAGDEVLVPSECCHRVVASVVGRGARPVLVPVGEKLVLSADAAAAAVGPRTRAIVAVHHLGLPCDVVALRRALPAGVRIVEDAAQAFDLRAAGAPIGAASDLVTTLFGPTKWIRLGGGGAVFGDAPHDDVAERDGHGLPIPYPLHPAALGHLDAAVRDAEARLVVRRRAAERYAPRLERIGLRPWRASPGDEPSWTRLPLYASAAAVARLTHPALQHPHERPLWDLPMFRDQRLAPAPRASMVLLRLDDAGAVEDLLARASEIE